MKYSFFFSHTFELILMNYLSKFENLKIVSWICFVIDFFSCVLFLIFHDFV